MNNIQFLATINVMLAKADMQPLTIHDIKSSGGYHSVYITNVTCQNKQQYIIMELQLKDKNILFYSSETEHGTILHINQWMK